MDELFKSSKLSMSKGAFLMNLRHLVFFKELARTQYMAKAAENLGISQPSLSYAIKKLEHELGVPLFEADGQNIKLTSIGGVYLKYVTATLTIYHKATNSCQTNLWIQIPVMLN